MIDPVLAARLRRWAVRWTIGGALVLLLVTIEPRVAPLAWVAAGVAFGTLAAMVAAHFYLRRKG